MNITQIRNATQLITYAGKRFLIDPMLAPKGAYPGFPGTARADIRNPMVELPVDVQTLLDTDAVTPNLTVIQPFTSTIKIFV